MAKNIEKKKALELRKKGYSYSQIRKEINVSKSTLSVWLADYPLSKSRIDELRGKSAKRIEKFRITMRKKRDATELESFKIVKKEFGQLSSREILIAGLFLYWGEGTKAASYTTALSNTDPDVMRFYMKWLNLLGVGNDQVVVRLHLYRGMNIDNEVEYWSDYLKIPIQCFRKPYIKKSKLSDITYLSGFKHGTCNILYYGKELYLYIKSGLKYMRTYTRP